MNSPAKPPPLPRVSFLRKLFVVIAIVILTSLPFGAIATAIHKARKSQAKKDCVNLVQAVGGYFDDYGRLPPVPGAGRGALTDKAVMDILLGHDLVKNPKALAYFSGKLAGGSYQLVDPWRKKPGRIRHYYLLLDLDGDGWIPDPVNPGHPIFRRSAAAWSTGPDGKAHPDPAHPDNRDNVYSWK